ncbi:Clp protease N-terminal domain-containing protein [[Mycobacterium] burgundiense]|jgi:ATP-dependent Clp protease ATP-binding subunit ClpA|uniref:Clp protease N-terminal domain-containing protein n=1 Tax=[Mycobacterium] burgundiense TaxID=3064286 RepID=A0ABM9M1Y1_9MYCO|nr:Clp protease N-terminal domain-containing protein [Mycolicibacterium sp. MU0053]CAJ1508751.1 Clp protease N-terminal domain-containing protein [Mycolicibacterium sp. MU0053]
MFERFSRSARAAVVLAQEEARDLGAGEIGPEHLLVGALQSAGEDLAAVFAGYGLTADGVRARLAADDSAVSEDDAEALRAIGIDLHAVREAVSASFGPGAFDAALGKSGRRRRRRGHLPFNRSAKKSLELALREALAHKSKEIRTEHVVLGIVRAGDRYTLSVITEHVYVVQLRAAIVGLLNQAA